MPSTAYVTVTWKRPLINAVDRYYDLEITCDGDYVGQLSEPGDSFDFSTDAGRHTFQISGMARATAGSSSGGMTAPLPGSAGGSFEEKPQTIRLSAGDNSLSCKFTFMGTRPVRLAKE